MSVLVVLIILLVTAFLFSLELKRRRVAEAQLQEALASVEQQVADRTDALSRAMAELELSKHELHLALDERAAALDKAESARRLAEEASHLKDEFLATASHELRTPLNAIVGWVHVLQSGASLDEEQRRQAVNAIDRNAKSQTRLIEDLLDVSRMIQGRVSLTVSALDLRPMIESAVDTIRHAATAKAITIAVNLPPDIVAVIGDEHRLQQVIWNLLANSVKYTPRGGHVDVSLERERGRAVVRVKDSGEGIDPSFLPHVFEPFRQGASSLTMRSGLGLGLAIVRRLVDLHGGRIAAESGGAGRGATFTVSLPLAHGAAIAALAVKPDPSFHNLHVLVAEDDADSAAAVTAILKLHGCETQTAGTAADCLRITGEWPVCAPGRSRESPGGRLPRAFIEAA